ncbi:MAG: hypothetical protein JSV25_08925 [Spirochaetota bacterium]|nr:MAG: hypothetical protein JSV25_08925 [Spirochaetota bacterium]
MEKLKEKKDIRSILVLKQRKPKVNLPRRTRIEKLKVMINNEDYLNEAIQKLANSLTSGLMK